MQNFKSFGHCQHGPFSLQDLPQNAIFGPGTYLTHLTYLTFFLRSLTATLVVLLFWIPFFLQLQVIILQ